VPEASTRALVNAPEACPAAIGSSPIELAAKGLSAVDGASPLQSNTHNSFNYSLLSGKTTEFNIYTYS